MAEQKEACAPCCRSLWLTDSNPWYASSCTSLGEPHSTRSLPSYLAKGILKAISSDSTSWSANRIQPARVAGTSSSACIPHDVRCHSPATSPQLQTSCSLMLCGAVDRLRLRKQTPCGWQRLVGATAHGRKAAAHRGPPGSCMLTHSCHVPPCSASTSVPTSAAQRRAWLPCRGGRHLTCLMSCRRYQVPGTAGSFTTGREWNSYECSRAKSCLLMNACLSDVSPYASGQRSAVMGATTATRFSGGTGFFGPFAAAGYPNRNYWPFAVVGVTEVTGPCATAGCRT